MAQSNSCTDNMDDEEKPPLPPKPKFKAKLRTPTEPRINETPLGLFERKRNERNCKEVPFEPYGVHTIKREDIITPRTSERTELGHEEPVCRSELSSGSHGPLNRKILVYNNRTHLEAFKITVTAKVR